MTEVTKEDREAAQALYASGWKHVIYAFARHHEASTEALQTEVDALRAENARLREALRRCAAIIERHNGVQSEKVNDALLIALAALENRDD